MSEDLTEGISGTSSTDEAAVLSGCVATSSGLQVSLRDYENNKNTS